MVTVSGFNIRQNKSGENFIALELTGSLEIVQSQTTGNLYATVRRSSMPSTFDENVAKLMVGSKLDGEIVRVACDPYEYTVKRTGEQITLGYTYAYRPAGSMQLVGEGRVNLEDDIAAKPQELLKPIKANSNGIKEAGAKRTAKA